MKFRCRDITYTPPVKRISFWKRHDEKCRGGQILLIIQRCITIFSLSWFGTELAVYETLTIRPWPHTYVDVG